MPAASRAAGGFRVDDVTVGPYAHGFGDTGDGRLFAFRTVAGVLDLEIYRADLGEQVPGPDDVVAWTRSTVTEIDLDDERSIIAFVRDLVPHAVPTGADGAASSVWSLLGRIGAAWDRPTTGDGIQ